MNGASMTGCRGRVWDGARMRLGALAALLSGALLSGATVVVLAATPAGATTTASNSTTTATATSYDIASATAMPLYQCTDISCGAFIGYTYTGYGTCAANCAGFPAGLVDVTMGFDMSRLFPPSPCMMKSGTGTFDAMWTDDPSVPVAKGTFTFKARDSHVIVFSGLITSSAVAGLPVGEALSGFVTFPPSPCTGGTAQAGVSFGG